jgi:penicillin G amidase
VISGNRTATGRPILASDPHRALTVPSLRYLVHVSGPSFDVIGGGEPALPGISLGHNGQVAFGLTIFPVDQEDLYVYQTDPVTGASYRYGDSWVPMEIVPEVIPVRGAAPVSVELKFTRHGPVLHEDREHGAAFAVRAAWLEPGMAPYLAGLALMRAQDWPSFQAAVRSWRSPGENLVYADAGNNIGWQPAALVPVRPNWSGLLPVPGDGRYEWAGFLTAADLPAVVNPERGWIATANQRNVDASEVGGVQVGFEWETPFRFERIREVLGSTRTATVAESADLQNDYLSRPARELCALLRDVNWADARAASAARLLTDWDQVLAPDSAAAALFEVWLRRQLRPELLATVLAPSVPADGLPSALGLMAGRVNCTGDARIDLALIEGLRTSPAGAALAAATLERTLVAAMSQLEDLLGPDPATWNWGDLHTADLVHPLARTGQLSRTDPLVALGPQPRGGSGDTVGSAPYRAGSFTQNTGASLRLVIDVGSWDNSVAMNSPGQSGNLASPHYADLYQAWARGDNVPLLYTRDRIEAVAQHRLLLRP